ncbi:MAG: uracil-DNA glycosylase [Candidatus Omnitrophica bacterium]|nr:uracil-DNA glycosylase [Candidatus Omnitrophota bacterium]
MGKEPGLFDSALAQTLAYIHYLRESGEEFAPAAPKSEIPPAPGDDWTRLKNSVLGCVRCSELARTRKSVVFGSGNAKAKLMFIGEAPGFDEDQQGLPFVGKAGQLLTKIIEAMGLARQDVFIANVLKCRPPGNRNPLPEEIMNCKPYLLAQIGLIRPRVICALGNFAAQVLLQTDRTISQLRGKFYEFEGIKILPTYHPAYLLRNPADKKKVWEDMKLIMKELEA